MTIAPASGLSIAPYLGGVLVYDPSTERAHHLDAFAGWLLGFDAPTTLDEVACLVTEATGLGIDQAHQLVTTTVATLDDLGLFGPHEPPIPISPLAFDISGP